MSLPLNNFQARFVSGTPHMVTLTPASDVTAGDVWVVGDLVLIAHVDIPANTVGAMAIGGGVYEADCSEDISFGAALMWDDSLNQAKKDTTGTVVANLGFAVSDDDNGSVLFFHQNGGV